MNKRTEEQIILYLIVVVMSVALAAVARWVAVSAGADDFTAMVTFLGTIGLCGILYLTIRLIFGEPLVKLMGKFLPAPKVKVLEPEEAKLDPIEDEVKTPPATTLLDLDKLREERLLVAQIEQEQKRQIALDYTQKTFAPHLTDDDMKSMLYNIDLYAENKIENGVKPIRVKGLLSSDLYHFGWNIWNHFKTVDQMQTAKFLQEVFKDALKNVGSTDTIKKKLRVEDDNTTIQLEDKLSE